MRITPGGFPVVAAALSSSIFDGIGKYIGYLELEYFDGLFYHFSSDAKYVTVMQVPEPAGTAFLAVGVAAVIVARRRRKKTA